MESAPVLQANTLFDRRRGDHRNTGAARPTVPTLLREPPTDVAEFTTLKALARQVKRLRGGRPLRIQLNPHTRHMGRVFPAHDLFAIEDDGRETWLGAAAIQSLSDQGLRAALEAVDPQMGQG